ncbi:MAG TPA: IclR family transcriptional regulator [Burkholderiaceae bacterium]|nr:IclR family transcriptional regulator [Pseudomonadota bacterium]MDQ7999515.1 IclR family transcriptional regulator [Pseudomonadota bacterium]MDQ8017258.1 IclR family transcriptional regulator [Pseudomonadota bacterium]HZF83276.1 IclR family transcriptional regulator [Burkholderiaceae bacterium]
MPRKSQTESIADENAAPGGAAAVDRALSLLGAFSQGDRALSLAVLAERTRLYKSTVLRLLASLEHAGFVQRLADGRYALGPEIARLHTLYAASFSLEEQVVPVLRSLVDATGESAAYHVLQGQARLCLYRVDSPQPIRDHIRAGDLLPLGRGSGGRVIAAYGPPAADQSAEDRLLYERIRNQGYYAASGDRLAGVAGISAPVLHANGALAGAVTLTMPATRYTDAHIPCVLRAAATLARALG